MPKGRVAIPYKALRPKDVNEKAWRLVVEAWTDGLSDREAAFHATKNSRCHIRESDIKQWKHDNPEVAELCEFLQSRIVSKAKMNVKEKIEQGDIATSKWLLERKAPEEFSSKAAVAFEGAAIEVTIGDKEKALKEIIEKFENNGEQSGT